MNIKRKTFLIVLITLILLLAVSFATYAYLTVNKNNIGNFNVDIKTNDIDIFQINAISNASIIASDRNFGPGDGYNQTSSAEIKVSLETTKDTSTYCYNVDVVLPPEKYIDLIKNINNYVDNNESNYTSEQLIQEFDNKVCSFTSDNSISTELSNILCQTVFKDSNYNECNNNTNLLINNDRYNILKKDYCDSVFSYTTNKKTPELVLSIYKSVDGIKYNKIIDSLDITTKKGIINIPDKINSNNYKNTIIASNEKKEVYWKAEVTLVWLKDNYQGINDKKSFNAHLEVNLIDC